VLATDDDGPLLGLLGTTRRWGPSRGITDEAVSGVDRALEQWAAAIGRRHALAPGAGAGGGIGFGLLAAGATRAPGLHTMMAEIGLQGLAAQADLVVTGEGVFEVTAGSGRVPAGVAAVAMSAIRPCIALAGRSKMGAREMRALGVESVYTIDDMPTADRPDAGGLAALEALAMRVARTWSWSR
jgi:glycerate kinase